MHRILSIAAVHDLLTTAHEDDVDCAELIGRLEAMLGQGLGGREVVSRLEPVTLPGQRATAVALVFCELFQNALEHGRGRITVELRARRRQHRAGVGRRGRGAAARPREGLGLTIAAALVREELRGRIELRGRAVVRFPAVS